MKSHYCEAEGTVVGYEGECNWCGEKEMTKLEQAARQALECLEDVFGKGKVDVGAITALREALAGQAEQEPVVWFVQYKNRHEFVFGNKPEFIIDGVVEPLYAAPVHTKDLTDDEIWKANKTELPDCHDLVDFARAVIAADREKNK